MSHDTVLFHAVILLLQLCPFTGDSPAFAPPGSSDHSLWVCAEELLDLWDWMLNSARAGTQGLRSQHPTPSLVHSRCTERLIS